MIRAWPLLALLSLAACKRDDMYTQGSFRSWDRNAFFRDQSAMRKPVDGTVSRNPANPDVAQPATITAELVARGRQRFEIFCAGCHGQSGDGRGMIVQRGFPQPPELYAPRLLVEPARHFYDVITNGQGEMYSFATRVAPADRWAIVAYVRALQQSQSADPARLPAPDRARLEAMR